jgi:predicted membrane protein
MHFSKNLPRNSKTTFEMRKNTFEVFQNVSNVISALIWLLIFIYLQRGENCLHVVGFRLKTVYWQGIRTDFPVSGNIVYTLLKKPPA